MDRKIKLINDLGVCRQDLHNIDYSVDNIMDRLRELIVDYEEDTGDKSLQALVKNYITIDQVKSEVVDFLVSSDNFTTERLKKVSGQLASCSFNTYWCIKAGNHHYYSANEKDVANLIEQLIINLHPESYEKYKRQIIQELRNINIDDSDDLEDTYTMMESICIKYAENTGDPLLKNFCKEWFLSTSDLRDTLRNELDDFTDCPDDLATMQRKIKWCQFTSSFYQKFSDGTYIDLGSEGLKWLKHNLLFLLGESDD